MKDKDRSRVAKTTRKAAKKAAKAGPLAQPAKPPDYNKLTPKFCLNNLQPGFTVQNLSHQLRADFAMALQNRASMTWAEIITAPRHGLGQELIERSAIVPTIPEQFQDTEKFIALRYSDRLPMVGLRTLDVFQIVWIEAWYGRVYDHG